MSGLGGSPNVALVVMDTTRALDTVPADEQLTPTLATLASRGMEFTNAFASAPWTLPSHASLFTGTYSSKHGAHGGHTYLDDALETLAETFAGAGYETLGISNNTWITEEFGFERGFETLHKNWQFLQSTTDLGAIIREKETTGKLATFLDRAFDGNPFLNVANALASSLRDRHDDGAGRTNRYIERWLRTRTDDRPFFCFANYLEPHLRYRPPREHVEERLPAGYTYEEAVRIPQDPRAYDVGELSLSSTELEVLRALYRGELAYLDERIGELLELFDEAGVREDTIVVVVGDHGENVGEHGFLGHQYNVYDTLLHVPMLLHGGPFVGGERVDSLVQLVDVAPTLLDAAGIGAPAVRAQYQGHSFHPDASTTPREFVVAEYVAPQPSIESLVDRFGDVPAELWTYDRSLRTIRTAETKYIRGSDGSEELYDVAVDPLETTDLRSRRRSEARALGDRLDEWVGSFDHTDVTGAVEMSDSTRGRLEDLGYL